MSQGSFKDLPVPPAIPAQSRDTSSYGNQTLESPSGSFSGSYGDGDPQRWSFPASQYRQSAVLEMGSAVPMEIVNPKEPREIQIQRAMDSLEGRTSRGHSRVNSGNSSMGKSPNDPDIKPSGKKRNLPVLPQLSVPRQPSSIIDTSSISAYGDPLEGQLAEPWSASTPSHKSKDFGSSGPRRPPSLVAPLSPLNHSGQQSLGDLSGRRDSASGGIYAKENETFTTAHGSSTDDSEIEYKTALGIQGHELTDSAESKMRTSSRRPISMQWDSTDGESADALFARSKKNTQLSTLRQLISHAEVEGSNPESAETSHSRSISEPSKIVDSSQATPLNVGSGSKNLDRGTRSASRSRGDPGQSDGSPSHSNYKPSLPHGLMTDLPDKIVYPTRGSSRRRGYDTVSPRLALQGESAILDTDSHKRAPSGHEYLIPDGYEQYELNSKKHHRKSYSQPIQSEEAEKIRSGNVSRRRRNFTKKSIENMLETNPNKYDIGDIGLPKPERLLLEKFIDSLSKLSIEVQLDDSKRDEGRRRLNNALRALEGWI